MSARPPRGAPVRLRAVLFDLDGTLVDTAPDLAYAANRVRRDLGRGPLPLARYRPHASAGARGLLQVALGITPEHPDFPARRDRFLALYREHLARKSRLFDGMDAALRAFERRGIAWGVVTNKPQWLTDPLMAALRLDTRAAVVIGITPDLAPKPAPDGLLRACAQLGLRPPDCVYVGDDERDIAAARAAAMPAVAAAWGYLRPGQRVADWRADRVVRAPRGLLRLAGAADRRA
jgi:N-acetyl-D-muramate 6-phosphate phosphatase